MYLKSALLTIAADIPPAVFAFANTNVFDARFMHFKKIGFSTMTQNIIKYTPDIHLI